MAELKTLQDFYNPTLAMAAMNAGINQQHLALQQQQVENQNKNMQIDNLQKALSVAGPMDGYPIYKQILELQGQQAPSVEEYMTSNPRAQAQRGNKKLATAALGEIGNDEDVAAAVGQSHPLQGKIGDVLAQTPLERMRTQEHKNLVDNVSAQVNALLPVSNAAKLGLERTAPLMAKLAPIMEEYEKNKKSLGITKAAGIRRDKILADPELEQFNLRSQQSVEGLTKQVQQIEDMQMQLQTQAELIATGNQPLQPGQNLHDLAGRVDASVKHLTLAKAQLAFAKDKSPANFEALKAAQQGIDAHIAQLHEKKNSSQDRLAISRDAQQETARKNQYSEQQDRNLAQGQALVLEAVAKGEDANAAAARVGKQLGVAPADLKKALANPDKPLVSITQGQEKAEASVVGTEFGKQYTTLQNAAVSASDKLSKLDRMEQLLQGVNTGKLTPAITQVQAIGEALGIQVDKTLPAKQALESLTNEIALGLRNPSGGAGMPGALSDKDREFLLAMPAGLGKTPEGNRLIIETSRALEQRSQHVAKMARAYRKKNGQFDEGFLEELQTYSEKHPLFSGKDNAAIPQASDYDSLPSGSVYQAPDGTMRRKK